MHMQEILSTLQLWLSLFLSITFWRGFKALITRRPRGPVAESKAKHVTNISGARRRVERSWQSRDPAQQLQKLIRLWCCC